MKNALTVIESAMDNHEEPIFVLRAKDLNSLPALKHYWKLCKIQECTQKFNDEISDIITEFGDWQRVHSDQVRIPD